MVLVPLLGRTQSLGGVLARIPQLSAVLSNVTRQLNTASSQTDLKAVLASKIPAEQVRVVCSRGMTILFRRDVMLKQQASCPGTLERAQEAAWGQSTGRDHSQHDHWRHARHPSEYSC